MSSCRQLAPFDSEGLIDGARVARHYSRSALHSVKPHSHYFHPMLHRDQSLNVDSATGREHLARTRKLVSANILPTPCAHHSNVPLREMLAWHQGEHDQQDDEHEWVVEHLNPGRGMVKRVCRKFAMHHWSPDRSGYAHNGFLAKVQRMKEEDRKNSRLSVRQSAFL
eukprot:TRINITY_DN54777_c0_g1_i2.p1 TRINITY_DN54777_c0_g1~~TRINITY_DN54777_c0_g1_i2.p1  ORF type:complete len:167 (+),score=14.34 TRINITY_DN54777_c0_g1_i2:251-751(+)